MTRRDALLSTSIASKSSRKCSKWAESPALAASSMPPNLDLYDAERAGGVGTLNSYERWRTRCTLVIKRKRSSSSSNDIRFVPSGRIGSDATASVGSVHSEQNGHSPAVPGPRAGGWGDG